MVRWVRASTRTLFSAWSSSSMFLTLSKSVATPYVPNLRARILTTLPTPLRRLTNTLARASFGSHRRPAGTTFPLTPRAFPPPPRGMPNRSVRSSITPCALSLPITAPLPAPSPPCLVVTTLTSAAWASWLTSSTPHASPARAPRKHAICSVRFTSTSLISSPKPKVNVAASSTRPPSLSKPWWRSLNQMRAAFTTPAAVPAACLFRLKSSSPATIKTPPRSPCTAKNSMSRPGAWRR